MWDPPDLFDGPKRRTRVNLSTNTASSSSLLSNVKKERLMREERRRQDAAAIIVQRVWRARRALLESRRGFIGEMRAEKGVVRKGKGLVGLYKLGVGSDAVVVRGLLGDWVETAGKIQDGAPAFLQLIKDDRESGAIIVGLLLAEIMKVVAENPTTVGSTKLTAFAELVLDPKSYQSLGPEGSEGQIEVVRVVAGRSWVENVAAAIEKLVLAGMPKTKHPNLAAVTRLATAPLEIAPPAITALFVPPLITHLLAIPALPQSLPIPTVAHLSQRLPLFTTLLPAAAANPDLLTQGKLATEYGRTYFLANIATFGLTGGMLARHGVQGANTWVKVVAVLLASVGERWGKWAEGIPEDDSDIDDGGMEIDSDSEDDLPEERPRPSKSKRQRRQPLPKNISSKLLLLGSTSHVATLADLLVSSSSNQSLNLMTEFAYFILGLLTAFKGTPRWEATLDGLLEGRKGVALTRRMWREGVRGKWGTTRDQTSWQTFTSNPAMPCLILMTHLYCHYLLLTPDDEFFAQTNRTNPLSPDEILELGAIWRDLAFWGYMSGVSPDSEHKGVGDEDTRALFTKGVTRLAARNDRRKFAPDEFWVMSSQMDLQGFVEAAVFEDAELALGDDPDESHIRTSTILPTRMRYTKRQMALISPRLGLLNNLPMTVPFRTRLEVFRQFVEADRRSSRVERYRDRGSCRATVNRKTLAEDGFRQLNHEGPRLKGRIKITFIDEFGQEESGIDGGGLFKEFLTSLSKEAFDTNRGLWLVTDENQLYPNPHSYAKEAHQLSWYGFIGRVLGKALYDGILVDVSFARFFLAKWLGRSSYLDDLASLDRELYKGLTILKSYPNPEELSLNFTITEQEFGIAQSIDLIPGGSEISVTAENRQEYIQLVCKYKLDKQIAAQSRAFFHGLSDIVDPKWLRMFDQAELAQLIGGENTLIDMDDLREHSVVSGYPNDKTIKAFWKVVKSFNQEQRRSLIKFVTSCARPPLLGFAHLNPQFGIRFGTSDKTRLPSASSCANLLKLPDYQDEHILREKLLQAINSGAGFDLS